LSKAEGEKELSGKLWMFSDQLDDEDLEFARHSFFRYADGIAYYRLTEKTQNC